MVKPKKLFDYEKKNQEMIQKMQAKKAREMQLIEEERRKMMEGRDKLRKLILNRAAKHKKERQVASSAD